MTQIAALIILLSAGTASFAQAPKPLAEIPFEFIHNQIVVQVKIGGKGPFSMTVDTDTDPSAIDLATARDLGLAAGSKGAVAAGGGNESNRVYSTRLPSVELGNFVSGVVAEVAIDLTKISQRMERPV